ncbi:glutamate mutase L [Paenibacillus athensensis]|uniref:MutL protein n=1 Tax=Paenibacillus athensensis TaxID=1967502 RepID=A0A4Y8Q8C9_9BACL|nr:methylaspartate mutase accessory protein GlmL [Paenibacillus athensensis]MCD1257293.1 glutamate mutase L [Paenibacillus athensensis]
MDPVLCIDFGSTYTKLTAIDLDTETILAAAKDETTGQVDMMLGFRRALARLEAQLPAAARKFRRKWACSSAHGGLKMVAIGLVPELTAEAAKRAALGAGSRMLGVYHAMLSGSEIRRIAQIRPDIILLAGGTDGGNVACILHNARLLADHVPDVPVIVAGNKSAADDIAALFHSRGMNFRLAPNVLPRVNELNVEPVREAIRELFAATIVQSKGLADAERWVGHVLMPTPTAVLHAARLLSQGTKQEAGIGELVVVDIGGATTDVHSIGAGAPMAAGTTQRGLEEPFAKRTVEGDLGTRVSALAVWEAAGERGLDKYVPIRRTDWAERCRYLSSHTNVVPQSPADVEFDEALAAAATEIAMDRHAGRIESVFTPMGIHYAQFGKDLRRTPHLLGTGGVLVHSRRPEAILRSALYDPASPQTLKPERPRLWLDASYALSALGLLASHDPNKALRMLKAYMQPI